MVEKLLAGDSFPPFFFPLTLLGRKDDGMNKQIAYFFLLLFLFFSPYLL